MLTRGILLSVYSVNQRHPTQCLQCLPETSYSVFTVLTRDLLLSVYSVYQMRAEDVGFCRRRSVLMSSVLVNLSSLCGAVSAGLNVRRS